MTDQDEYMIAWCKCITPRHEEIQFNSSHLIAEEARPHTSHIQRKLTADLLHAIREKGGPWGWVIGPLHITTHPMPRYAQLYAPWERNPVLD